jgi:hypothetical protein
MLEIRSRKQRAISRPGGKLLLLSWFSAVVSLFDVFVEFSMFKDIVSAMTFRLLGTLKIACVSRGIAA